MNMRALIALALLMLTPTLAFAHTGVGDASGFMHGFEHPIGGLDHVLAMVAVGVLAAVLGGRALWLVPASFVGMMLVGFGLGAAGAEVPFAELAIAVSSIAIGAAAAWGKGVPVIAAMALAGGFAVFHGFAHGAEMPVDADGFGYAVGFVLATAGLHALGIAATVLVSRAAGRWGKPLARVAGAAFALGGVGILAGWL
jgi:urease accessory protein